MAKNLKNNKLNKKGLPGSIFYNQKSTAGFTLVEMLFVIAIFAIVVLAISTSYVKVSNLINFNKMRVLALSVASGQIEIAHNLPYEDVGTIDGIPNGKILSTTTVSRGNLDFVVKTTIRNIDDLFDGQIGSSTKNDTAPADYKFVQVDVSLGFSNPDFKTLSLVTYIAPKNLENNSTNGALLIRVIDAEGKPISGASVHLVNTSFVPNTIVDDVTNDEGKLDVIDVPPAGGYHIEVSKTGYSSDKTYAVSVSNPVPSKPDSMVATQQATAISFGIDRISSLNVKTAIPSCSAASNISFNISGSKQIGENPAILKYPKTSFVTDEEGNKTINNLEWDSYDMGLSSASYDLVSSNPTQPIVLVPNSAKDVQLVVAPKNSGTILFSITDSSGLPITDAVVALTKDTFIATSSSNSTCLPPGKVAFTGISSGLYNVNVSKSGYGDAVFDLNVAADFTSKDIILLQ